MKEPLVSVVVPTYKRPELLPLSIESILNQSYKKFHIIISDDCSPDNTEEVARELKEKDSRIEYQRNKENLKEYMNVNRAIWSTRGKYLAVLQDDGKYINKTFLQEAVSVFENYPEVTIVAGHYSDRDKVYRMWDRDIILEGDKFWEIWPRVWCHWIACVFRYETAATVGFVDTSLDTFNADSLFLLKMALMGHVALLDMHVVQTGYAPTSSYTDAWSDPIKKYVSSQRYYQASADFAKRRGISEEKVEQWYNSRLYITIHDVIKDLLHHEDKLQNFKRLKNTVRGMNEKEILEEVLFNCLVQR